MAASIFKMNSHHTSRCDLAAESINRNELGAPALHLACEMSSVRAGERWTALRGWEGISSTGKINPAAVQ